MKSKISERILKNTSDEIKIKSRLYGDELLKNKIMKQLRFTTTKPYSMFSMLSGDSVTVKPLTIPDNVGEFIEDVVKGRTSYIHGDAETLAGFDIPTFLDGNLGQLDLPVEKQDILMVLPSGEYPCKAEISDDMGSKNAYLITLKK